MKRVKRIWRETELVLLHTTMPRRVSKQHSYSYEHLPERRPILHDSWLWVIVDSLIDPHCRDPWIDTWCTNNRCPTRHQTVVNSGCGRTILANFCIGSDRRNKNNRNNRVTIPTTMTTPDIRDGVPIDADGIPGTRTWWGHTYRYYPPSLIISHRPLTRHGATWILRSTPARPRRYHS